MERAFDVLTTLERFLKSVLNSIDLKNSLVILTSDHGNIEDLSVRSHTRNPAMTLLFGKGAESASHLKKITAD